MRSDALVRNRSVVALLSGFEDAEVSNKPSYAIALALVDVRSEMLGEVVSPGEALATHLAVVGPFTRVDTQVPRQIALAAESAAAEQADERTLAGVLAHV